MPLPERQKIAPIGADKLNPILDRYAAAAANQRLAVWNEIEKLGLAALPGVLARRDAATDKDAQATWNDLAKQLSCIVTEVEIAERSAKPDATVVKRMESLKGKPFDAKTFIQTIGDFLKNSPADAQGLRVVALRAGDGTGFTMNFEVLANPKNIKGPPSQWGSSESVRIGKDFVRGQFGSSNDMSRWTEGNYPDLDKALTQVVASAPDQPVEIRVHMAPEWREK